MQSPGAATYLTVVFAAATLGCAHDVTSNAHMVAVASVPVTTAVDTGHAVGPGAQRNKIYRYGNDSLSEELALHWTEADAIEFTVRAMNRRTGASFSYAGTGIAEGSAERKTFLSDEGSDVGSVRITLEGEEYARVSIILPESGGVAVYLVPGARLSAEH
jgi:hypothetical protein